MLELGLGTSLVLLAVIWYFRNTLRTTSKAAESTIRVGAYHLYQESLHSASEAAAKRGKRQEDKGYELITAEQIESSLDLED